MLIENYLRHIYILEGIMSIKYKKKNTYNKRIVIQVLVVINITNVSLVNYDVYKNVLYFHFNRISEKRKPMKHS